jgi:hypothetical protein
MHIDRIHRNQPERPCSGQVGQYPFDPEIMDSSQAQRWDLAKKTSMFKKSKLPGSEGSECKDPGSKWCFMIYRSCLYPKTDINDIPNPCKSFFPLLQVPTNSCQALVYKLMRYIDHNPGSLIPAVFMKDALVELLNIMVKRGLVSINTPSLGIRNTVGNSNGVSNNNTRAQSKLHAMSGMIQGDFPYENNPLTRSEYSAVHSFNQDQDGEVDPSYALTDLDYMGYERYAGSNPEGRSEGEPEAEADDDVLLGLNIGPCYNHLYGQNFHQLQNR